MEAVDVKAFPLSWDPEGDYPNQPQAGPQGMSSRYSVRGPTAVNVSGRGSAQARLGAWAGNRSPGEGRRSNAMECLGSGSGALGGRSAGGGELSFGQLVDLGGELGQS